MELNNTENLVIETENKNSEWESKYMYLAADFQNYKNNMQKRINQMEKMKHKDLILHLLDVIDNCERSFAYDDTNMPIYDQLLKILHDDGLEPMDIHIGDEFDSSTMNAVMVSAADGSLNDNSVSQVFKNGYKYKGEIIRFADVVVCKH